MGLKRDKNGLINLEPVTNPSIQYFYEDWKD
jgi:hypothetical protein